jgi:hypothetical protein
MHAYSLAVNSRNRKSLRACYDATVGYVGDKDYR